MDTRMTALMILCRVSKKPVKLHENATPVTQQSIAAAINWVKELTFMLPIGPTSCLDALLEAGKDRTVSVCWTKLSESFCCIQSFPINSLSHFPKRPSC